MTHQAATKQVTILERYFVKASQTVICRVLNGEGKKYLVTLHKNGNTCCTCRHGEFNPNHAHCHHVKHVQEREAARTPDKAATFAALMQQYDVRQVACDIVKSAELDTFYSEVGDPRVEAVKRSEAPLSTATGKGWSLT